MSRSFGEKHNKRLLMSSKRGSSKHHFLHCRISQKHLRLNVTLVVLALVASLCKMGVLLHTIVRNFMAHALTIPFMTMNFLPGSSPSSVATLSLAQRIYHPFRP